MTNVLIWLWLQKKLGYASRYAMDVLQQPGGARFFYESTETQIRCAVDWPPNVIRSLRDRGLKDAEDIYIRCLALGHMIITPESDCYPASLRRIADPPLVLYASGDVTVMHNEVAIAVVGTRRASQFYSALAKELGYRLSRAGAVVVSGCAVGIDSAAHAGSVAAGGVTIGVLGCGINTRYNVRSEALRNAITTCGVLVSEYPPGTEARPEHFPQRNRLISGLSLGVVVVQAGRRSGSLITARMALEQGRDLYAYYSETNLETIAGIHMLGESNVTLINSPAEILRPYEARFGDSLRFDGTDVPLMSDPVTNMPRHADSIVSDLSAQVKEKYTREVIRPVNFPIELKPVAVVSLEEVSCIKSDGYIFEASSERARSNAMPCDQTEIVDYSLLDRDDAAVRPDSVQESAAAEKIDNSATDSNNDAKYNAREPHTSNTAVPADPLTNQVVTSAREIGLTDQQIEALLAKLEQNKKQDAEASANSGAANSYAHSKSSTDLLPADLSDEARRLYAILQTHSDTVDNLSILSGMTISMTAEFMLELELYGLVNSKPGGIYSAAEFYYQ